VHVIRYTTLGPEDSLTELLEVGAVMLPVEAKNRIWLMKLFPGDQDRHSNLF
jgi:hypothetical protein